MSIPFLPQVSGSEPHYIQMSVTPEMARCWLKYNHNNRKPPSKKRIETYRRYMESGEWNQHSSHLSFTRVGLIDGQHRLMAISGLPDGSKIPMGIFVNMPEGAVLHMDCGWGRTLSHRTNISKDVVSIAQWMDRINVGGAIRTLSPAEMQAYYDRHRDAIDWVLEHRGKRGFCRAQYRVAMVWLYERDECAAREFFAVFHGLVGADVHHPAVVLRNKVVSWLASTTPAPLDIYLFAMMAVNAQAEGRPLSILRKISIGRQPW